MTCNYAGPKNAARWRGNRLDPAGLALIDATRAIDLFGKTECRCSASSRIGGISMPALRRNVRPVGTRSRDPAKTLGIPFLGRLPLSAIFRCSDEGHPPAAGEGAAADAFATLHKTARRAGYAVALSIGAATQRRTCRDRRQGYRRTAVEGANHRDGRRIGQPRPSVYRVMHSSRTTVTVYSRSSQDHRRTCPRRYIWRELGQIVDPIDIVDIFRNPTSRARIYTRRSHRAKAVWMQLASSTWPPRARRSSGLRS